MLESSKWRMSVMLVMAFAGTAVAQPVMVTNSGRTSRLPLR